MQMLNGKSKYVDLDYNLNIQRDKADLLNNPSELKEMAMDAFKEYFRKYNDVKVRNSTSAITVFLGNVDGYICSFDCAFIVEGNDGYYHKLVFDKNFQRYIWNRLPKSNGCFARYEWLKKNGYIAEIEELYREKKNHSNCDSSNLFVKTVNELFNKYEK